MNVTDSLIMQERVNEFVHVGELKVAVPLLRPDLPIVVEQRLKVLVAVQGSASQPQVVGTKCTDILEVLVLDELDNDVLFRLDLQHLENKTKERSGFDVASKDSSNEPEKSRS